jgi:hypothetical protein
MFPSLIISDKNTAARNIAPTLIDIVLNIHGNIETEGIIKNSLNGV